LDGSDAMNPEPDYSAAYVVLRTDSSDGLEGHALAFTTGRGNDVQAAAIAALAPHVVGLSVGEVCADLGAFSRSLVHDPQLRWLGPEKGAIHMATGAVVNAAWDLAAKRAGKPVWRFLAEMSPEELVAQVDFRWLSDALTPEEALEILRRAEPGRQERIARLLERGYPAYTTTPDWLGYSDEKLARLAREAVADGFTQIKLKVGASLEDDVRRMRTARRTLGDGIRIAVDANQRWDVRPAIDWMRALAPYRPYWIEEPSVDLRAVVRAQRDVPDEVEPVLDAPLRAGQLAESLRGCLLEGQVGDRVDGLAGEFAGLGVGAESHDSRGLDGTGEVHSESSDRQRLDDPQLTPPVSGVALRLAGGDVLPRQRAQGFEQQRLVLLDDQQEVRALCGESRRVSG